MSSQPDSRGEIPEANRVAIVHDWLYGGGAERVIAQLHQLYPEAPIYTGSTNDRWRHKLDNRAVTGWPDWWLFRKLRKFLPLPLGWWFRSLDLSDYDLIIVSTGNGEAKQITNTGNATVVCYCHTPVHFYWRHYRDYVKRPGFGIFNPLARLGLKLLLKPLRRRDYAAAQRIDHWIANSTAIKTDIKQFYDKDAVVIHPPVDVARFKKPDSRGEIPEAKSYFITVGRLVPYKRVDIIIDACNHLGLQLKVVGRGPQLSALKRRAGENVEFITNANDQVVAKLLQSAMGFVFAAHEDFGVTPVESLAAGTPVIAYRAGGALDYVNTSTGLFFDEQTSDSLQKALTEFNANDFDSERLQAAAERFDQSNFRDKFSQSVADIIAPQKEDN